MKILGFQPKPENFGHCSRHSVGCSLVFLCFNKSPSLNSRLVSQKKKKKVLKMFR